MTQDPRSETPLRQYNIWCEDLTCETLKSKVSRVGGVGWGR